MRAASLAATIDLENELTRNAYLEKIWSLDDPVQIAIALDDFVRKMNRVWQTKENVHHSFSAMFY